jgi:hypothetical protein
MRFGLDAAVRSAALQRRIALLVAGSVLLVAAPSSGVSAHYFGGRYADDRSHVFVSTETTNSHFNTLDPIFTAAMAHLDAVTVMWDVKRARNDFVSTVDIYWFATPSSSFSNPNTVADTTCIVAAAAANRCDSFRVRFNESYLGNTANEIRHDTCHEILHTVGADDGGSFSDGCLGSNQTAIYMNQHEKDHVDANHPASTTPAGADV